VRGATVGFIGLGNMGSALAANLVDAGHTVITHDLAGLARSPHGATFVTDLDDVASGAEIVVLSLPDGNASATVVGGLVESSSPRVTHVVDTSTVGLDAARELATLAARSGVHYIDAPVSGGVAGARARTLTVMYAGTASACDDVMPVLEGLSDRRFRVGDHPGMAQAVKLANNFLSATALAATSEAVAFATAAGVDMATMLDVINASSGRSAASEDKFVNHVLPGSYSSGFANTLMAKDVDLYLGAVESLGSPSSLGRVTAETWRRFADADRAADFTRIYPFTIDAPR
jgi:3-hydroxyisobutyrate dehydrogenase-like beta-hydroxyacid dehydrogenase